MDWSESSNVFPHEERTCWIDIEPDVKSAEDRALCPVFCCAILSYIMRHIGKETSVTINGKQYRLSRFTRKVLRDFLEWADKQLGDPLDAIKDKLAGFPPNVQEYLVKDALERASLRRSINSPEVQALMATPEGIMKILSLLFQQHQPGLTDADVEDLYETLVEEMGQHEAEEYLSNAIVEASGRMPVDETQTERAFLQEKGLLPASNQKKG